METVLGHNPKPSHAKPKPTIEGIREWDTDRLLQWIQQTLPNLLKGDIIEKFKEAYIDGFIFLKYAGKEKEFHEKYCLPLGISERLADLAAEIAGKDQDTSAGESNASLFIPVTLTPVAAAGQNRGSGTKKRKRPPSIDAHATTPSKRARVGKSSLVVNGKLRYFRSGSKSFSDLLQKDGQAYFDRTDYILKLHELDDFILFCRPRRFGKSLTVSMLQHFHGLQYADEHQTLYQGLDVQKDIDKGNLRPGRYFVLKFDFSMVSHDTDRERANKALKEFLNHSIWQFYATYATYFGQTPTDLYQKINSDNPIQSLSLCAESVRQAIANDEDLADVEGIYVLVDEYDAFANGYLELSGATGLVEATWEDTIIGHTLKSFWASVKSLGTEGYIKRAFITGISPLSLSCMGSAFNVARNMSFESDLAGLCGLTYSDLEDTLQQIKPYPGNWKDDISEMAQAFNGYHFCMNQSVGTVFNTETCLMYLQHLVEGKRPQAEDPPNSEVSEDFLEKFITSARLINDFDEALGWDEDGDKRGDYTALEYSHFKSALTLRDLRENSNYSWRSLVVYIGGLTFHPKKPKTHLKIPNMVAANRIASAVLQAYNLRQSLPVALDHLHNGGAIEHTLGVYRKLMTERDKTPKVLTDRTEEQHRDSFDVSLLANPYLHPQVEVKVTKGNGGKGFIDLVLKVRKWLIVTEWKFLRIQYLEVPNGDKEDYVARADRLNSFNRDQILQLTFSSREKYRLGTIESSVKEKDAQQLREFIKGDYVRSRVENEGLQLRAYLVIIVGSRHILLWEMDQLGNLTDNPHLVETPKRLGREECQEHRS